MGEAEYSGLASLFQGFSEGVGRYQAGREAKRQAYRDCVFMGGDPQECAYKTGYTPKGEELGEAAGVHGRRQAQARQTMMEETAAEHRPVPVRDVAGFGLPIRERLRQATISPGEPTTVPVKKDLAGEIYRHKERLAGEERAATRAKETRITEYREKRGFEEFKDNLKREFELWKRQAGITGEGKTIEERARWIQERIAGQLMQGEREKGLIGEAAGEMGVTVPGFEDMLNVLEDVFPEEVEYLRGAKTTESVETIYNRCRAAGGSIEECKAEAGIE